MKEKKKLQDQDRFEDLIRKKIQNYSLPVDESVWENMDSKLRNQTKKKISLWPWIAGLTAAACIALIWLIFPFNQQVSPFYNQMAELSPKNTEIEKRIAEKQPTSNSSDMFVSEDEKDTLVKKKSFSGKKHKSMESTDPIALLLETSAEPGKKTEEKEEEELGAEENTFERREPSILSSDSKYPISLTKRKKEKASLGIHIGSSWGNLTASNDNSSYLQYEKNALKNNLVASNSGEREEGNQLTGNDFSDVSHYSPISFGFSFRKYLNRSLSIETGLIYSYLYSKFENKIPREELKQELHYLGIPVNAIANIYSTNSSRWNIYGSAGVLLEKGLSAHYVHTLHHNNSSSSTSSSESIGGVQWSLNAALGLDFKLTDNHSLYLEPSVGYYLKNNQPLNSRTKDPLNIRFTAGFRYSW